jgi:hypothetical protein
MTSTRLRYEQFRTLDGKGADRVILRIDSPRRVAWRVNGERRTWYAACRDVLGIKRRTGARDAARKLLASRLAFIVKTCETHSPARQATEMGVSLDQVYWMRNRARDRGYAVRDGHGFREMAGLAALKDAAPCPRCRLRGEHDCLPSIYELASSRRAGGPVFPTGGP